MKMNKKPLYSPVITETACLPEAETIAVFALRIIVKIFLVCLITVGLCVTLAQVYRIPVSLFNVAVVCVASVTVFNIGLLFFKKRVVLLPLLFFCMAGAANLRQSFSFLLSHLLHVLDSRLLSTAQYAKYPNFYDFIILDEPTPVFTVAKYACSPAFLVVCMLISLGFTFAARSRFIGIMLVTSVFLFAPAFGAEIAGYFFGIELMVAGMVGVYSAWVAHSWESVKAEFQKRPVVLKPNDGESLENFRRKKRIREFFKITPGKPPHFYKYSRNSLLAAGIAAFAAFTSSAIVTDAVDLNYDSLYSSASRAWESALDRLGINPPFVRDNGFFPSFSSSSGLSTGISLNKPPTGTNPVLKITLEDDSEKMFFRGGIGIEFTGDEWTTAQDSYEYRRMLELLHVFSPETEYDNFLMRMALSADSGGEEAKILRQNVVIEYLTRTGFLLLPTQPIVHNNDAFKNNPNYTWHLDTYIRPSKRVRQTSFDAQYPIMSNFGAILTSAYETAWLTSPSERILEYRRLIQHLYLDVPQSEADNIDAFLAEAGIELWQERYEYEASAIFDFDSLHSSHPAQVLDEYLKRNYEYSIDVDNTIGSNSAIGSFLFETRSGHCAMYASVMTLAMRRLGFPARYVTGVVTVPNGGLEQTMAEKDFHAWVEVYFDGVGWLPFDPTGGANGQERNDDNDNYVQINTTALEPQTLPPPDIDENETYPESDSDGAQETEHGNYEQTLRVMYVIIGAVVAITAFGAMLLFSGKKSKKAKLERFKREKGNATAKEMYRFMLRLLSSKGIKALKGESPLEFARRADELLPLDGVSLNVIMPIFEKLEFGDTLLSDAEYGLLCEYVDALCRSSSKQNKS